MAIGGFNDIPPDSHNTKTHNFTNCIRTWNFPRDVITIKVIDNDLKRAVWCPLQLIDLFYLQV